MLTAQPLYELPAGIETRWTSAENWDGAKGVAGQANLGRKGSPSFNLKAGVQQVLAQAENTSGTVRRIWITINNRSPEILRGIRLDMVWDGTDRPAVSAPLGVLMDTFIGPMIYDYMPRSQMGTINAGTGLIGGFVGLGAANLGAWWIVFYSLHIHKPAHVPYDYTSIYLLQFILFVPAILAKVYFVRLVVSGKLTKWGAMEVEDPAAALKEEQATQQTSAVG